MRRVMRGLVFCGFVARLVLIDAVNYATGKLVGFRRRLE